MGSGPQWVRRRLLGLYLGPFSASAEIFTTGGVWGGAPLPYHAYKKGTSHMERPFWHLVGIAGLRICQRSGAVWNKRIFMPPWATAAPVGRNGRSVAFANPASLVTMPTRQPEKRALRVLPSAPYNA